MSMPIADAAPGRFSMTTLWFSDFDIASATMRAVRSVPPPGVKGTMILIGWLGYAGAWDQATTETRDALAATASVAIRCSIGRSSLGAGFDGASGCRRARLLFREPRGLVRRPCTRVAQMLAGHRTSV